MNYRNSVYQNDIDKFVDSKIFGEGLHGKKILITGASGMIGAFLVDALMRRNEKYQEAISVYAVSRNIEKLKRRFASWRESLYLHLLEQDVSKPFELDNIELDYIVHAASNTHPKEYAEDAVGTITTNIFGAYYLLEYAKVHKRCRVVMVSSVEIYGENRGDTEKFDETYSGYIDCNTLRAGYPESKRLSEALLQAYIAKEGIDGVIIRLCRVFGPTVETDDSKASTQFIFNALNKQDIVLKSEGKQLYSYLYISDAVKAILYVMLLGKNGEAYNAADEASDITLYDMAAYLAELSGKKVIFELPQDWEKKGYSTATKAILNAEKLKSLGWSADYSVKEGLKKTLEILKEGDDDKVR